MDIAKFFTMDIYWLVKLDDIRVLLTIIASVSIILVVGSFFHIVDTLQYNRIESLIMSKIILACSVVLLLTSTALVTLIPSTKQMASIMVFSVAEERDIPSKILTLADEWLEELRPKREGN